MGITNILYNTQVGFLDKLSVTSYWTCLQPLPVCGGQPPLSQGDDLYSILILSIFCAVDIKFSIPTNCTYGNKYTLCHSQNILPCVLALFSIYKGDSVTKEIICCCRYIQCQIWSTYKCWKLQPNISAEIN